MAAPKKLSVPRATRVDEDIARELLKLGDVDDHKAAEVDRQILTWFAFKVAKMRRPGEALKHFLGSLQLKTA